jgi:nicotinate phosphoribosyltransferase
VYKLVEINGHPRIKLSEEVEKVVIPCRKNVYRIWGKKSFPVIDVIQSFDEPAPEVGVPYFCRHPFFESKRGNVTPSAVVSLLHSVWDGPAGGVVPGALESIVDARERCREQLRGMREDHVRPLNPTPYKVSLSSRMYECLHELWLREAPITDIG